MKFTEKEVLRFIAENDVKFIKLMFTDIFGSTRSISIMPDELPRAFSTGISFDASAVKGFMEISESDLFLVPDPSTLSVLPWRPQHGRVVRFYCSIIHPDGTPFDGDTRRLLQNTVAKAEEAGFTFKIGTECEFYLFQTDEKGNPTMTPHDTATYCDVAPRDRGENVRRDICLTLEEMEIKPETSHHETGPGQHEIDFKCAEPVAAADNLSTFKIVVKTIAVRNGLFASFMPKPIEDKSGNGLHINISVYKNGINLFAPDKIDSPRPAGKHAAVSETAGYFMAGILSHITEMTAFLNPLENSYKRFGVFEAPKYISWSRQNRSQLIRLPAAAGDYARMELRSPDPCCNQYVALSLILSAGLEGIKTVAQLPKPTDKNMETQTGAETLPLSFSDAAQAARSSSFVQSILPEKIIAACLDMNNGYSRPSFGEL